MNGYRRARRRHGHFRYPSRRAAARHEADRLSRREAKHAVWAEGLFLAQLLNAERTPLRRGRRGGHWVVPIWVDAPRETLGYIEQRFAMDEAP